MTGLLKRLAKADFRSPWLWGLILALGLILAGGLIIWLSVNQSPTSVAALNSEKELQPVSLSSPTPFRPGIQETKGFEHPVIGEAIAPILPTGKATPEILPFWHDFDFSDGADQIEIHLVDQNREFFSGKPVLLRFVPGAECPFGSGRGCVSEHDNGRYLLLTLHSGVTGEAQQLRHSIEGTGINIAGVKLDAIQVNLESLTGSIASLHQGTLNLDYLDVRAAFRISPDQIEHYYSLPFSEALKQLAADEPLVEPLLEGGESLIFIETCGWPVPGEPAATGKYKGTGSVYLVVLGSGS